MKIEEVLENGGKIPFQSMDLFGNMKFYELDKDSRIEVEFLDGNKLTMNTLELIEFDRKSKPKPLSHEIIVNVNLLEKTP